MSNDLLNETEVAKKLRVSLACLRRWRLEKRGPTFIKIGQLVRYQPEDLVAWLRSLPVGGLGAQASRSPNDGARGGRDV